MTVVYSYSHSSFPPIPIVEISLSAPNIENWLAMQPAIVDSGADFTIVPLDLLRLLSAPIVRSATLSSHARDRRSIDVYEVDLLLGEVKFPYIEVVGDPKTPEILLGRNLLNLLDLRLEGPRQRLHILA
jgi:predicted aspartyl protease